MLALSGVPRAEPGHPTYMTKKLMMSVLAATGLTLALAPAAQAQQESDLVLTVQQEQNGTFSARELHCDPAGGTHPFALSACDEIEAADGDLTQLPGQPDLMCTFEYDPVRVSAVGTWRGEPVDYTEEFPNICVLQQHTGSVFTF